MPTWWCRRVGEQTTIAMILTARLWFMHKLGNKIYATKCRLVLILSSTVICHERRIQSKKYSENPSIKWVRKEGKKCPRKEEESDPRKKRCKNQFVFPFLLSHSIPFGRLEGMYKNELFRMLRCICFLPLRLWLCNESLDKCRSCWCDFISCGGSVCLFSMMRIISVDSSERLALF